VSSFFHWFLRVIRKWFWVLGFLPLAVDLLTTYIPEEYYRYQLKLILGNWIVTGMLFLVGFIVSAYLVHIEDQKEIAELSERITEVENREPILEVGFLDKRNDLDKSLQIHLSKIPDPPDYDELLRRKRQELSDNMANFLKKRNLENQYLKTNFLSILDKRPNPNYENKVVDYLEEYRNYLGRLHNYRIMKDRVKYITPIVTNVGSQPANDIKIDFLMPGGYIEPTKEQYDYIDFILYFDEDNGPMPPEEPSVTQLSFVERYEKMIAEPLSNIRPPEPQLPKTSNTYGPDHQVKNGRDIINYSVEKLIQQRSENNFEPFLLWLEGLQESTNWKIEVNIYCAEYINSPKTDTLYIDFIVDQE
jgi:hypothetical protein